MGLAAGSRIGAYEVTAALGAGGMGEVYRARDTVLKRDVALKVLPDSFTGDPDRLTRFQREAEVLASLNHPHIAHIHGLETSDGVRALVLEFVDGPTLADRIAQGPIPIDEALPIAHQIAEAIEAAHEHGIIHRDLKPANIKVTASGEVKVLDFGLARALGDGDGPDRSNAANSPTLSLAATRAGVILGTAAYMSPEQAKGKPVDRRSDIWSFGIVLFEMLTGRAVYSGETISETMAHVITRDPDWTTLPADTPPRIRALLGRCLIKDPRRRLQAIGEARIALEEGADQSGIYRDASSVRSDPVTASHRRRGLFAVAALALTGGAIASAWVYSAWFASAAAPAPTRRFTITLPESDSLPPGTGSLLAISPDGRTLVYAAARGEQRLLFRRSLDQFDATPIIGAEEGRDPFFSPDGQWIGFIADRVLRKAPLSGGTGQSIVSDSGARGPIWTPDGRILFTSNVLAGTLNQISAAGGATTTLFTSPDQRAVWYPQFIPESNAVVFTLSERSPDAGELHAVRLDTGEHRTVVPNAVAGRVLHTGHLVFVRSASLWAVRFDRRRLETIGEPVPVVEGVKVESGGAVQYAVADDGSLAYIPGSAAEQGRGLVLVDRKGTAQRLPAPAREYDNLAWSPDQTRVAVQVDDNERADVWVADPRGTLVRLTTEPGFDGYPLWTLDGSHVVFASLRDGRWQLRRRAFDGTGETTVLASFDEGVASVRPYSWSPDGETLLFDMRTRSNQDIGVLSMKANSRWNALIAGASNESQPAVSPDGRWIAYTSTESGASEVFLQRFPMLGDRRLVSVGFGHSSSWARDGRTLYYLRGGPPDAVMRVTIETGRNAGALTIGSPEVFQPFRYYSRPTVGRQYGVSHDGDRLLAIGLEAAAVRPPRQIHIVLNWHEELKRLVPIE